MNVRWRLGLPLAFAFAAVASMLVVGVASGTHARPKGATPILAALVITYKQCTTATNRQHGPPLAALSCNPPVQTSSYLTVGTGDAWPGTSPKSAGYGRIDVKTTSPEDVKLTGTATDIRCRAGTTAGCGSANTDNASVPDYAGEVEGNATIRITDHFNGPVGGTGGTEAATVQDLPFPVTIPCANTADTTIGGTCTINSSANAVVPGAVQDAKRALVEVQNLIYFDGGADGLAATAAPDNTLVATQGIWIP
jgi:hypothetical protein